MGFKTLPKVELHLHFDCSLSYAVVSRINPSITLEAYCNDCIAPAKCTNLVEVVEIVDAAAASASQKEVHRNPTIMSVPAFPSPPQQVP